MQGARRVDERIKKEERKRNYDEGLNERDNVNKVFEKDAIQATVSGGGGGGGRGIGSGRDREGEVGLGLSEGGVVVCGEPRVRIPHIRTFLQIHQMLPLVHFPFLSFPFRSFLTDFSNPKTGST